MTAESDEHKFMKEFWINKLTKKGYDCQTELSLYNGEGEYMIIDVYAENEESIVLVEVINTSWSGKDPKDYIDTYKTVVLIISPVDFRSVNVILRKIGVYTKPVEYEKVVVEQQQEIKRIRELLFKSEQELRNSVDEDSINMSINAALNVLLQSGWFSVEYRARGECLYKRFDVEDFKVTRQCAIIDYFRYEYHQSKGWLRRRFWSVLIRIYKELVKSEIREIINREIIKKANSKE